MKVSNPIGQNLVTSGLILPPCINYWVIMKLVILEKLILTVSGIEQYYWLEIYNTSTSIILLYKLPVK
jgi:hypothetical protein